MSAEPSGAREQRAIAALVRDRREGFEKHVGDVWYRARDFGAACANALGEISRDEAIDAIKREVCADLERLR